MAGTQGLQFEHSVQITAAPTQVLAAFFDPVALATWWNAVRSVTAPRPMGIYAIEWDTTPFQDEVLGTLGGVFAGREIEKRVKRKTVYQVAVAMDAGGSRTVNVDTAASISPGTRVRVQGNNLILMR